MSIWIRDMTLDDIPAVAACQQAAFGHPFDQAVLTHEFRGCHRFNPDGLLVAVDEQNAVVGTIWGAWNGRRAVISGLAVRPDHQGNGIARQLIATVEERFRAKGVTRFSLEITTDNHRVIPLYEHLGFKIKEGIMSMGKNLNAEDGTPLPQPPDPESSRDLTREAVLELWHRQLAAMDRGDTDALGRIFSPDAVLVHMTGHTQPREEWFAGMRRRDFVYHRIEEHSVRVLHADDTSAELEGRVTTGITDDGSGQAWPLRMEQSYRLVDGTWYCIRSQVHLDR